MGTKGLNFASPHMGSADLWCLQPCPPGTGLFVGPFSTCSHHGPSPSSRAGPQGCWPAGSLLHRLLPCVSPCPGPGPPTWFRGVRAFRISQPTPKILFCEVTLQEALRNHISLVLGGSSDTGWCYRRSKTQSPADRAGSDTRAGRFTHREYKRPRLQSSGRCFSSPVGMPPQAATEGAM